MLKFFSSYRCNVSILSILGILGILSVLSFGITNSAFARSPQDDNRSFQDKRYIAIKAGELKSLLTELSEKKFDIAGIDRQQQVVGLVVNDEEFTWVEKNILNAPERFILETSYMNPLGSHPLGTPPDKEYFNPTSLEKALKALAKKYPFHSRLISIGESFEGKKIWALRIGSGLLPNSTKPVQKPALLFNGLHHAREVITPEVVYDIGEYLLNNYDSDQKVRRWVDTLDIWIVPMVNPDGSQIVFDSDNMWRKNAHSWLFWTFGVDLNRNYSYDWGMGTSSDIRTSNVYKGTEPLSEPESAAMDALNKNIRFAYDISYHAFGEMVLFPFSGANKITGEDALFKDLAHKVSSVMKTDTGNGYAYGMGKAWELLYPVGGCDDDHHYVEYGTIAFTIEVGSWPRNFQPVYKDWRDIEVSINRAGWQTLLDRATTGAAIELKVTDSSSQKPVVAEIQIEEIKHDLGEKPYYSNTAGYFYHAVLPGTYHVKIKLKDNSVVDKVYEVGDQQVVKDEITL